MNFLKRLQGAIDGITEWAGKFSAAACLGLVCVVFYDVVMRYVFQSGSIAMQELEWHLFSALFLLGASYTLQKDEHVRVDTLYMRFKPKTRAVIDAGGALLFVLPLCAIIIQRSLGFVSYSYSILEKSNDPGGLPFRFIIKAFIPAAFVLLFVAGLAMLAKNILILADKDTTHTDDPEALLS